MRRVVQRSETARLVLHEHRRVRRPQGGGWVMDYEAIVIGSGFGGTVAATKLAAAGKRVLILERGGWWVSPISLPPKKPAKPGDPPPPTQRQWLENDRKKQLADAGRTETDELVNFWARPDHARGLLDLVAAVRTRWNPDGLWSYRRVGGGAPPPGRKGGGGGGFYPHTKDLSEK